VPAHWRESPSLRSKWPDQKAQTTSQQHLRRSVLVYPLPRPTEEHTPTGSRVFHLSRIPLSRPPSPPACGQTKKCANPHRSQHRRLGPLAALSPNQRALLTSSMSFAAIPTVRPASISCLPVRPFSSDRCPHFAAQFDLLDSETCARSRQPPLV